MGNVSWDPLATKPAGWSSATSVTLRATWLVCRRAEVTRESVSIAVVCLDCVEDVGGQDGTGPGAAAKPI